MEKKPLSSKKFISFLFSALLIAGILIMALITQQFSLAMSLFMCIGIFGLVFIAVGYILSQAALDKLVRGVEVMKGFTKDENTMEE